MKIQDLAALVQVRNHILTVINDKSVTNRDEFKPLNEARLKLDKKFVEIVKDIDVDSMFPNELLIVKVGHNPSVQELENWRDIFEASRNDPDFKIFTHDAVSVVQLSVDPKSEVRVCPAVEPASIEVSPNISIAKQLPLPFESSGRPGDRASSFEMAADALTEVANTEIKKLEESLVKLQEQNVTIAPALVAEAAKPIQAPEEVKQVVVEKARKAKLAEASQDPDIAAAIARQKEELKQQGRSNKKVKRDDD
jgi:hypothetical protein